MKKKTRSNKERMTTQIGNKKLIWACIQCPFSILHLALGLVILSRSIASCPRIACIVSTGSKSINHFKKKYNATTKKKKRIGPVNFLRLPPINSLLILPGLVRTQINVRQIGASTLTKPLRNSERTSRRLNPPLETFWPQVEQYLPFNSESQFKHFSIQPK